MGRFWVRGLARGMKVVAWAGLLYGYAPVRRGKAREWGGKRIAVEDGTARWPASTPYPSYTHANKTRD